MVSLLKFTMIRLSIWMQIRVAEIAYDRHTEFEKYALDQIQDPQVLVETFEKLRVQSEQKKA